LLQRKGGSKKSGHCKQGADPVPRGPTPKFARNSVRTDRTRCKTGVSPLEVQRERSQHQQGKPCADEQQTAARTPNQRTEDGCDRDENRTQNLERPEEPDEEGCMLAVPAEELLRLAGPPEGNKDSPLREQGTCGESQ